MADEIELSIAQIKLGVYIQNMIDAHGACLVPSDELRMTFQDNEEGFRWLCVNNLWSLHRDSFLDLTRFSDMPSSHPKPQSIKKLAAALKRMEATGQKEADL